jgi:hypothetical protein
MKNIHLLPTDKPSKLHLAYNKVYYLSVEPFIQSDTKNYKSFNIYITSDEKPKQGEWSLYQNKIHKCIEDIVGDEFKKIILTTDDQLIADGVQAIDDEFLEWFVKNPSCEEIKVVYDKDAFPYGVETAKGYGWYKIIIPKEEPKQETLEESLNSELKLVHDVVRNKDFDLGFQTGGIFGAKWQADRMYSEEEVLKLLRKCHFVEQNIEEWFEQYKKKQHGV